MTQYPMYVPNPTAPAAVKASVSQIDLKSAIVGVPIQGPIADRTLIYFEGNRYNAANVVTLADRALIAAGRLAERYPTVASATVPSSALQPVGTFTPGHGIDVPDAASLVAVAQWLELVENGEFDAATLHRELRLSGSRTPAATTAPVRGQQRIVTIEFLTDHHFTGEEEIADLIRRAVTDDLSMLVLSDEITNIDAATLASRAGAHGSDPGMFGLSEDGTPLE